MISELASPGSQLRPLGPRVSVADQVFARLKDEIVGGRLAAGADLPSERTLAEQLGVSRGAVREGIARLAHANLVLVRQGDATRVKDFRAAAGLDLLPGLLFDADGHAQPQVFRAAAEMRAALAPDVARRCAERAPKTLRARIDRALVALSPVVELALVDVDADLVPLRRVSADYWTLLLEGTDNLAYQLAYNSLRRAFDDVEDALAPLMRTELVHLDGYRAITAAIAAHDGEAAAAAARHHCSLALADVQALFSTGGQDD